MSDAVRRAQRCEVYDHGEHEPCGDKPAPYFFEQSATAVHCCSHHAWHRIDDGLKVLDEDSDELGFDDEGEFVKVAS